MLCTLPRSIFKVRTRMAGGGFAQWERSVQAVSFQMTAVDQLLSTFYVRCCFSEWQIGEFPFSITPSSSLPLGILLLTSLAELRIANHFLFDHQDARRSIICKAVGGLRLVFSTCELCACSLLLVVRKDRNGGWSMKRRTKWSNSVRKNVSYVRIMAYGFVLFLIPCLKYPAPRKS